MFTAADTVHRVNRRNMPNFVPTAETVTEIWPFFDFSRWRSTSILDFKSMKS